MAPAPPLVFEFVGVVFTAILYGLYCLQFGLYCKWRIQLEREERWKGVLLYALTATFILCTVYVAIAIFQVQFFITENVLETLGNILAAIDLTIASNAIYIAIDFTSQLILLYRCWILWRKPLVMVFPCIVSLGFLVTALMTLGLQIKGFTDPTMYISTITAFFFLSLGANAVITALIVYKIVTTRNDIREFDPSAQASAYGKKLNLFVSILMESGLISFLGQLTQCIMYASVSFPLVAGGVVILYGISSTILGRVDAVVSYDHKTSRPAKAMSLASV